MPTAADENGSLKSINPEAGSRPSSASQTAAGSRPSSASAGFSTLVKAGSGSLDVSSPKLAAESQSYVAPETVVAVGSAELVLKGEDMHAYRCLPTVLE